MTGPPWASLPDGPCRGNFQVNYCLAPSSGGYLNFRLRTRSTTQGFTVHKITQLSVLPSVTHVLQAWCWEICHICFPLIPKALKEFYVKLNQYCKAIFPQLKLKKIQSRDNNLGKKRVLVSPNFSLACLLLNQGTEVSWWQVLTLDLEFDISGDVVLPAFVGKCHGTGIVARILHGHVVYE